MEWFGVGFHTAVYQEAEAGFVVGLFVCSSLVNCQPSKTPKIDTRRRVPAAALMWTRLGSVKLQHVG